MANTTNLSMPLVAASQAQKHLTVNEALSRLDGLVQLRLLSRSLSGPPVGTDGAAYGVPVGATNAWAGHDGAVAIYSNGGWVFATPAVGWQGYIVDEGQPAMFDGEQWVAGAVSAGPSGAVSKFYSAETVHSVQAGAVSTVNGLIPANTLVFGVTGRVQGTIGGTASSFEVGVSGSSNRYGSGIGLSNGSYLAGLTGSPLAYYSDTSLELTATGGVFDGTGTVTLVAHVFEMSPPN